MERGTSACILAFALAATALGTSCTKDDSAAPTTPAATTSPAPGAATGTPGPTAGPASGPASGGPTASDPDAADRIRDRAGRLWEAKVTENWATVYQLRDPSVRSDGTEADYVAWSAENEPFRIEGYDLKDVLVDGVMAWVQVDAKMSTRQFASATRDVKRWDKWRFVEGDDWYPVPQKYLEAYPISPALRDRPAEDRLRERFMLSWNARAARDWQAYLDLYAPADREIMTIEEFAKVNEMFIYDSCDVRWVEVVGDRGHVRVGIMERVTDPSMSKMPAQLAVATEKWTKVDGEWYIDLGIPHGQTTQPTQTKDEK